MITSNINENKSFSGIVNTRVALETAFELGLVRIKTHTICSRCGRHILRVREEKLLVPVVWNLLIWVPISHMAIQLLINCKLRRSQSSLHTARRCIPNVPTYISIDHEHRNGIINSSLVGVIIGDWKFYNHQGLCFNSKRSIRGKKTNSNSFLKFFHYFLTEFYRD
ncbi:hypothetical protein H8356DRAFT_1427332 [Neocallimastix lanati (nom. inval.)]|nr:hypothetical protein H8356DRAFT_1427332 [Neocallimastix sp. JGI-2020a]